MTKTLTHTVPVYRGSIRISLNGDTNSLLRNKICSAAFNPNGFENDKGAHGTGLWVNPNCTHEQMGRCISELWRVANKHVAENEGPGKLDHLWSNFELIDLRSFWKAIQKSRGGSAEIDAFLTEQGFQKK